MNISILSRQTRVAMPATKPTPEIGDGSPWGTIETITYLADGIVHVETANHGGFHVSEERFEAIPKDWCAIRHGRTREDGSRWFEEDADWVLVALTHRDAFRAETIKHARGIFDFTHAPKLAELGRIEAKQ